MIVPTSYTSGSQQADTAVTHTADEKVCLCLTCFYRNRRTRRWRTQLHRNFRWWVIVCMSYTSLSQHAGTRWRTQVDRKLHRWSCLPMSFSSLSQQVHAITPWVTHASQQTAPPINKYIYVLWHRSLDRALDRPIARSIASSLDHSNEHLIGRSIDHAFTQPIARLLDRSIAPSIDPSTPRRFLSWRKQHFFVPLNV